MIPFNYNQIDSATEFTSYAYKRKAADKANEQLVEPLEDCTEKDGVELQFINIGKATVPVWKVWDMDGEGFQWFVLVDKAIKQIAVMSDFDISSLSSRSQFVARCKMLNLYMKSYKDSKNQAMKSNGELKKLGFDPAVVDRIWRKAVYDDKRLSSKEVKTIVEACKKLIDMMATKNPGSLGLFVYAKLCDELDIPTD